MSEKEELAKLRVGIDAIDDEVLRLINERAKIAHRIGEIKQGPLYRPEREAQVLRRLADNNPGPLPADAVQRISREIMSACLALEQPLAIAYLGPAGTYTESAAQKHFGGAPNFNSLASIDDVFRAVEAGNVNYGVIPVENSTEGAVGRSLDLLLNSSLQICGEVHLPIHHNLLGKSALADVGKVYAHAQALGQCHEWLNRHLPHVERIAVASNAEAARMVAENAGEIAAIAGDAAAKLYGLNILATNIEDNPDNTTRFLVLSGHDAGPSGKDKTSLVCSAQHRPGAVHELLTPFAQNKVSMTRFESRPAKGLGGGKWEYVFYIDIEGHRTDAPVAAALADLNGRASFVKILGSYPVAPF
ncbi:MAG TPA: prephenate dehydratase [Rhodocyclaceae bacterium]|jgi:chorismate mutase/prephenate dehydratase|nr:prephenate dehydratase [Rhodocyclaceae bacterium]